MFLTNFKNHFHIRPYGAVAFPKAPPRHYYIKDFARQGPNINGGGYKIYLSPKIHEDLYMDVVDLFTKGATKYLSPKIN